MAEPGMYIAATTIFVPDGKIVEERRVGFQSLKVQRNTTRRIEVGTVVEVTEANIAMYGPLVKRGRLKPPPSAAAVAAPPEPRQKYDDYILELLTVPGLEELAERHHMKVEREDGGSGPPTKGDYIAALRDIVE